MAKLKCNLKVVDRISKTGSNYQICEIKIYCDKCNAFVDITDFNSPIPVGVSMEGVDITLQVIDSTNNVPTLYIPEIGYTIPWKYRMAITLLNNHKCLQF